MSAKINPIWIIAIMSLFMSCNNKKTPIINTNTDSPTTDTLSTPKKNILTSEVLTAEKQQTLTPDQVIERLKKGNRRFVQNKLTPKNFSAQIKKTTEAQYPEAIILSCIDSRIPVENIFDKGIGDIFVNRIAGNVINTDVLGGLEYACEIAGAKLIVVLGHYNCQIIHTAIDNNVSGNIGKLSNKMQPIIEATEWHNKPNRTSKNKKFVRLVTLNNLQNTINQIRNQSPILKKMENKGEIKIIRGLYNPHTGKVENFEFGF